MNTSSLSYPNLFDVARGKVATISDAASIANRVKLLLLTEPTELYNSPTFGVGLKKYMFQYNSVNIAAQVREKLVEQLKLWEPCVDADATTVENGNLYSQSDELKQMDLNHLRLTVTVYTTFGNTVTISVDNNDIN